MTGHDDNAPPPARRAFPLGRMATTADVAAAIIQLACEATYVTGSTYPVEGGLLLTGWPPPSPQGRFRPRGLRLRRRR